jgi:integrase
LGRIKYVQRRANRYEFRYPLPDDLAGKLVPPPWPENLTALINPRTGRFKTEVIRSLQTNDWKVADRKALAHIEEAHGLVEQARIFLRDGFPEGITREQVDRLVREHEIELLERDEKLRGDGVGLDLGRATIRPDGLGMTDDDLALYRFTINLLDRDVRSQAAKMRPSELVQLSVDKALEKRGTVLHPDDPAWRQLELGFVRAERAAFERIKARLEGEIAPTPERGPEPSKARISSALKCWAEGGGRGARKPRQGSIDEAERAVERFTELVGDLPLTTITKAHGRAFRDALAKVPKALPDQLRQLRLPDLLKQDLSGFPTRSAQTINKTLSLLGGIMARAERDGFLEAVPGWSNPFNVQFEIGQPDKQPYEPFSLDELQRLFASPVFRQGVRPAGGRGEAAYWFPIISLFSGARRTEIAQLRVADVRQGSQGIWYFDFTDQGPDQNLKNMASVRSVPLHSELIRLGLLEYLSGRATINAATDPLWPGFEPPIDAKAKAWTKWFGRYLNAHGVDHPAKTFHSFRHTFKRACRHAGISEEIHHALTGHSGGGVGRSYGRERRDEGSLDRGVPLARLHSEINRVSFPSLALRSYDQG